MKAAELMHVQLIRSFLDTFFKGAYDTFSISGSSTAKAKGATDKEGIDFSFDLKGDIPTPAVKHGNGKIENICPLDSDSCAVLFKGFFEDFYQTTMTYCNVSWSYGYNKKDKEDSMSVSVCFKFA